MSGSHTLLDHLLLIALLAWTVADWLWIYPRFVRSIAAGTPGARKRLYVSIVALEWALTLGIVVLWSAKGRDFGSLFMELGIPWRLALGMALAAALIGLLVLQRRAVLARPQLMDIVRRKIAHAEPLVPHTRSERRMFVIVSLTAGACEEILFRGFVTWYFWIWVGPVAAVLLSALLFGFGHIYQGIAQVPKTGLVGLSLAIVVLLTGSLWASMIMHAAIDVNSGDLGFRVFGEPGTTTVGAGTDQTLGGSDAGKATEA